MRSATTRRADRLANELRQVLGVLVHRLRVESSDHGVGISEHAVLRRLLDHGPATTADLARAQWVRPQSMGATLDRLARARYIERSSDAADRRRRTISISARGRRLIRAGRAERQGWLARAIHGNLDAGEQRRLLSALEILRRLGGS